MQQWGIHQHYCEADERGSATVEVDVPAVECAGPGAGGRVQGLGVASAYTGVWLHVAVHAIAMFLATHARRHSSMCTLAALVCDCSDILHVLLLMTITLWLLPVLQLLQAAASAAALVACPRCSTLMATVTSPHR